MKNDKLHMLSIPSWYPEFEGDYVGSFFREQAIGISRQNCKVGIIYPELKSLRSLKFRFIPRLVRYDDMGLITYKILWSNWFIKLQSIQIIAFKYLGIFLFKRYIKKNGVPDIIHCQSIFNSGFLGEYIFDKYKIPYIITEHNSGFYHEDQGVDFAKFYKQTVEIINKSQKCFTVSNFYSKYLNNLLRVNQNWDVHHNIVDNSFLSTEIKFPNTKNFIFLCVSRLDKIKNIDLIIESFKKLNIKYPDSELRIVGVGSELQNLKNLTKAIQINKKVKFLGKKSRSDIINEYNSCNSFIYASSFETFGVVFVEAMALGRPIISLNCGSSDEIISAETGIIVKNKKSEDMSSAMITLYQNYSSYNPNKIREYCKSLFSEKKLSLKMISHYKNVLNQ